MNEVQFWATIEAAWTNTPKAQLLRQQVLTSNEESAVLELADSVSTDIAESLQHQLSALDQAELHQFILLMEEKLYAIDREEIHRYTDGSDDGFLYCRCFIVGMGHEYYDKINQTPSAATMDAEAEAIGFVGYTAYEGKFNDEFERYSVHSIESCSNPVGWPNENDDS